MEMPPATSGMGSALGRVAVRALVASMFALGGGLLGASFGFMPLGFMLQGAFGTRGVAAGVIAGFAIGCAAGLLAALRSRRLGRTPWGAS